MPWKKTSCVSVREDFALRALRTIQPFSHLCRLFGVSRKTGYKWLGRYRRGGAAALRDASRRPNRCANQKPPIWQRRVATTRKARPHWGAKKLRAHLRRLYPRVALPSVRTIGRWLRQLGLVGTHR